jgi:copper homeostasis protein
MGMTLEICVDSLALAKAAVRGGADRIEVCGPLEDGGVTPDSRLVTAVREVVDVPIAMLVRRRTGPFTVSEAEFEEMRREVLFARRSGVDIVVIGILQPDGTVDVERTRQLVELAYPMEVTFHRAFDSAPDLDSGLRAVLNTGASRLLTSGGSSSAVTGAPIVSKLQRVAGDGLSLIVCGGVTPENIGAVLESSEVREVHAALSQVAANCTGEFGSDPFAPFVGAVSELRRVMDAHHPTP